MKEGLLNDIMGHVSELNDIWDKRKEQFGQPLIFEDTEGLITTNTDLNNNGSLPNSLYIGKYNINARRKAFIDYFIKDDADETVKR